MSASVNDVPYSPMEDIEFVGKEKRRLNEMKVFTFPTLSTTPVPSQRQSKSPTPAFETATEDDMNIFLVDHQRVWK